MSEWISVEDRLPDNDCFIIYFASDTGFTGIIEINKDDDLNLFLRRSKMTHWMPLPEPPND